MVRSLTVTIALLSVLLVLPHNVQAQTGLYLEQNRQSDSGILPFSFGQADSSQNATQKSQFRREAKHLALVDAVQQINAQKVNFIEQYQRNAQEIARSRARTYSGQTSQRQGQQRLENRQSTAPNNRIMVYEPEENQENNSRRLWNPR